MKQNRQDATLPASVRRLKKAREDGQVARSNDLSSVLFLFVAVGVAITLVPYGLEASKQFLIENLSYGVDNSAEAFTDMGWQLIKVLAIPFTVFFIAAIFSGFIQVGSIFSSKAVTPNFSRLNFGFSTLFGSRGNMNLLFSLSKLILASAVGLLVIFQYKEQLFSLGSSEQLTDSIHTVVLIGSRVVFATLAILLLLGIFDYCWQRHAWKTDLLMTRQEVIEEQRDHGGRGVEARNYAMRISNKIARTTSPSLIISGSTFAISLRWNASTMTAPIVLDILRGDSYLQELDKLKKDGVLIIENAVLAQKIMQGSDVGLGIPSCLHGEIATLLITKKKDAR
jgi:flagellar biosynthetic protein FlhB